jgi:hypothetical protein
VTYTELGSSDAMSTVSGWGQTSTEMIDYDNEAHNYSSHCL